MKHALTALALLFAVLAPAVHAADAACASRAAEKKLAGAAKNSFMQKCERDTASARTACEGQAAEKKLAGAAKNSFVKKCSADAVAAAASAASAAN